MCRHTLFIILTTGVLVGCSTAGIAADSKSAAPNFMPEHRLIEGYLARNVGFASFGGQVFCAFERLDAGQVIGMAYIWALCIEHYLDGGALNTGSGISLPVAIMMRETEGGLVIAEHSTPRDGSYYANDLREIFPAEVIAAMCHRDVECYNGRAERLEEAVSKRAREGPTQD